MKPEYRYLLYFAGWMALWHFAWWIAFPLMLVMVAKGFMDLKRQRAQQAVVAVMHLNDKRWAELEGFQVQDEEQEADPIGADWWKYE